MNPSTWLENAGAAGMVLALGTTVMVLGAEWVSRRVPSAFGQRSLWRMMTVATLGLVLCEVTGLAPGLVQWIHPSSRETSQAIAPGTSLIAPSEKQDAGLPSGVHAVTMELPPTYDSLPSNFPGISLQASDDTREPAHAWREILELQLESPRFLEQVESLAGAPAQPVREWNGLDGENYLFVDIVELPDADSEPMVGKNFSSAQDSSPHHSGWPWARPLRWFVAAWGLGTLACLGYFAFCRFGLARAVWKRMSTCDDSELCGRVARLAHQMGLPEPPRVLVATWLESPVAFHLRRPTIGLPCGFRDEYSPQQQDAILTHELAHLASCDMRWHSLSNWVCAALWWQPLVWLARARLAQATELSADEACRFVPDGPAHLAECLVKLGRKLAAPPVWATARATGPGPRSQLASRVRRLLAMEQQNTPSPRGFSMISLRGIVPCILVFSVILGTAWARPPATLLEGGPMMSNWQTMWRRSLLGAAIVGSLGPMWNPAPAAEELEVVLEVANEEESEDSFAEEEEESSEPEIGLLARVVALLSDDEEEIDLDVSDSIDIELVEEKIKERLGDLIVDVDAEVELVDVLKLAKPKDLQLDLVLETALLQREESAERHHASKAKLEAQRLALEAKARQIEKQIHSLEREFQQARQAVERKMHELEDKRHQFEEELDRKREHEGENLERHFKQAAEKFEQAAHKIHSEAEKLEHRAHEKMEKYHDALHKVHERMQHLHELHEHAHDDHGEEHEELEHHRDVMEKLKRELDEAREHGKHEQAEQIEMKIRDIAAELRNRGEGRRVRASRRRGGEGDASSRDAHVERAIDSLRAAGLNEEAEQLMRHLGRQEAHRRTAVRTRAVQRSQQPSQVQVRQRRPQPRQERRPEEVRQLRNELEEVRSEMREMRGLLQRLLENREAEPSN